MRKTYEVAVLAALGLTLACGGVGGSGDGGGGGQQDGCTNGTASSPRGNTIAAPAPNVVAITVDGGINHNYPNGLFTTVKVCAPGSTTNCQSIDHVLVDTGSYGLRLLSNAAGGVLTPALAAALPSEPDSGVYPGDVIAECAQFPDGIAWGPVKLANIYIAGESATNLATSLSGIPIQIIADPGFSTVPLACTGTPKDSMQALNANGILGIGPFQSDCPGNCFLMGYPYNPGLYYSCPPTGCDPNSPTLTVFTVVPVWNPVAAFANDNNGVIIELPAVPPTGAAVVNGSLVFGIGTQSNNGLGNATVYSADPQTGNFTTLFAGQSYNASFIDSGSKGLFFLSSGTTSIQDCGTGNLQGFYCPTANLSCTATNQGFNSSVKGTVNFTVANPNLLPPGNFALNDLAGPYVPRPNPGGSRASTGFNYGLPFFYGRNVYTGIEGMPMPAGVPKGPFFAY